MFRNAKRVFSFLRRLTRIAKEGCEFGEKVSTDMSECCYRGRAYSTLLGCRVLR
jgi:hypothetical protein